MRGFDTDFVFGAIVFALMLVLVAAITKIFQFNFVLIFLIAGALAWLFLEVFEKRFLRASPKETPVVYCEWEDRINGQDFDANQKSTISDLQILGFTLEDAIGRTFQFHTEPSLEIPDLYFDGVVMRDEANRVVIRALKPLP